MMLIESMGENKITDYKDTYEILMEDYNKYREIINSRNLSKEEAFRYETVKKALYDLAKVDIYKYIDGYKDRYYILESDEEDMYSSLLTEFAKHLNDFNPSVANATAFFKPFYRKAMKECINSRRIIRIGDDEFFADIKAQAEAFSSSLLDESDFMDQDLNEIMKNVSMKLTPGMNKKIDKLIIYLTEAMAARDDLTEDQFSFASRYFLSKIIIKKLIAEGNINIKGLRWLVKMFD